MTLAELRAAREKAGATVTRLASESQAAGFVSSSEWEAGWDKANADYNAAVAAEEAGIALNNRANRAAEIQANERRLNDAGRATYRPDYNPASANPNRVPATARRHGPLKAFKNAGAEMAERAGMWAAATIYGNAKAAKWCVDNGVTVERGSLDADSGGPGATLNTADNARGGYFVPTEVDYGIQELALAYGIFRRFAELVSMMSGTRDTPRWTGGMTAYFVAEGQKPTQSDPAWDMIGVIAREAKAMTKMTKNLDEDSMVDLGEKIATALAEAFMYLEDNAGFNGDGTSTYGGITGLIPKLLAAAASYSQAVSGNVSAATLDLDDFNNVAAKVPNYPNMQLAWFMHKRVYVESVQRLQLAAGGTLPADVQAGGKPSLLGYPIEFTNVMSATPTVNEIAAVLGDLKKSSKFGDRRGRTVEAGFENDDFTKGLMTVLGTQRFGITNHTTVDPRNSSNPGPVVGLKLAAS